MRSSGLTRMLLISDDLVLGTAGVVGEKIWVSQGRIYMGDKTSAIPQGRYVVDMVDFEHSAVHLGTR
jgi:hypothetical protein